MTSLTLILESEPLAVNVACADKMSIVHLADDRILSVPLNWYPPLLNRTHKNGIIGNYWGMDTRSNDRI
ncbi:MAG: hypothetical protein WBB29_13780 [Geitlerinemataceae cyanobacterium]